ncbi:MAG TPA: protein translocase subunit SecF [Peptococcaceae bacterium]|jgi:preprotein translocase subunit SecF|nr:protein translocase subunit SecF [Peptococcaceae bacterium]HPZ70743.1 protein translocase subunit SecF [Peptococcaceae bacterium]HQD54397.1 protein translocase subunit SecF [Peptococcaceae bacterium]
MDFIGKRKIWYALSLIVLLVCVGSIFAQGFNYGIDFQGGSLLQLKFEKTDLTVEQLREGLEEFGLEKSQIQLSDDSFIIKTAELSQEEQGKVLKGLESKLGKLELLRNEKVGPVIGKELRTKALLALLVAWILQILYISFRFEFRFGLAAVLALLHDVIVTAGFFSIMQYEIDVTFVAAILTIIGYSINDTIVIFDRIRENLKFKHKEELAALTNKSIRQSIVRSLSTSVAVLFVLVALIVLGGETTKYFSIAMLVGVLAGTYSSIFVASSLWYDFRPDKTGKAHSLKV